MNAFFGTTLDLNNAPPPPQTSFEPMPVGDYIGVCTEFECNDNGKGIIANLKFQIIDGEHQNRIVWQSLPITHESEKAQSFGQSMLAEWCDALGVDKGNLSSGEPLMNKPVGIKLKIEPSREYNGKTYAARNQIAKFLSTDKVGVSPAPIATKPASKPAAASPAQPAASKAETQASSGKKMPWQK